MGPIDLKSMISGGASDGPQFADGPQFEFESNSKSGLDKFEFESNSKSGLGWPWFEFESNSNGIGGATRNKSMGTYINRTYSKYRSHFGSR